MAISLDLLVRKTAELKALEEEVKNLKKDFMDENIDSGVREYLYGGMKVNIVEKNTYKLKDGVFEDEFLTMFPQLIEKKVDINKALNHPEASDYLKKNTSRFVMVSKDKGGPVELDF